MRLLLDISRDKLVIGYNNEDNANLDKELIQLVRSTPHAIRNYNWNRSQGLMSRETPSIINDFGKFYAVHFSFMDPHHAALLLYGAAGRNTLAACALVIEMTTVCTIIRSPSRRTFNYAKYSNDLAHLRWAVRTGLSG